ncbi:YidB family protein [Lichenibacterium dinghuense]|uniref:YidB family protein n=1 Tax=Lichenibacterium dinghuense TaxID=2895977 RepID=UPI001F264DE7
MGILDSVIGNLLGGQNNQQAGGGSPLGGIISSVLGGGGAQGGGYEGQAPGGAAGGLAGALGGAGGIGGLLSQFQQAGLGHIAESWIGNGANQPVSPDQLQSVFGQGQTQAMADQAGMDHGDFLQQLSQALPQAVDGATQGGGADDGSVNV